MITIKTPFRNVIVTPTMFPDGTSQVWKLPKEITSCMVLNIVWNFEAEREIIDLLSLRTLYPDREMNLHMPYLPYGRQDKDVNNESTFNLVVLARLLNSMKLDHVSSVDTHNVAQAEELIDNFYNIEVEVLHDKIISHTKPNYIVYPDSGAYNRYKIADIDTIVCRKTRDQSTGDITGHEVVGNIVLKAGQRLLIVDDICDGGATFISIAKLLKKYNKDIKIDLFVTHGIFSKGREHLLTNGINTVYTTNSLLKNKDGYEV